MNSYFFAFITIILTVLGQIIIKARALFYADSTEGTFFLMKMFFDPWVLIGLTAALAASATWMLAVQDSNLSVMYPIMALTFVFVPLLAVIFFKETLSISQVFGLLLIIIGVGFSAR